MHSKSNSTLFFSWQLFWGNVYVKNHLMYWNYSVSDAKEFLPLKDTCTGKVAKLEDVNQYFCGVLFSFLLQYMIHVNLYVIYT